MQGVPTTDTIACCGEYVRYSHVMPSVPAASPPCFTCWYASHTISVVMGTLTPCLENSSIIPCGCFVFTNFYILCTPSLLLTFISYQHYYGYIRPCGWFVKAYYILRVLRLMVLPLCFSYVLAHLQTFLPIQHIQPVQVLQFRPCACL